MKTYKILGYLLVAFLLIANLIDKITINKQLTKIDQNDPQGAYYLMHKLPDFHHVVLEGNRFGSVQFYQRKKQLLLKHGGYIDNKFNWKVDNDTLFLKFNDPIFKSDISNFLNGQNNTLKNVVVYYNTIETITQNNNRCYLNSKNLASLKVNSKNDSWFHINNSKIGNLDIKLDNSWANFLYAKPTYVDSLSLELKNKSDIKLNNLIAQKHHFNASDDSKIKEWGFNQTK